MARTPHVVVLGGGFGGLSAVTTIRKSLDSSQVRITVVDRKDWFMVGFCQTLDYKGDAYLPRIAGLLG